MKLARSKPHPAVAGVDTVERAPRHAVDHDIHAEGRRLGELVVASNLAGEADVAAALDEARRSDRMLGRVLVEKRVLTESQLVDILSEQCGLPIADFRIISPSAGAIALVTEATARTMAFLPLSIEDDGVIQVAVADPTDAALDRVRQTIGHPIQALLAEPADLMRAIGSSYRATSRIDSQVQAFETRDALRKDAARYETIAVNDEAPVVQVVQLIITQGLRDRASDIHIEPSDDRIRVRYRIDGALHDVLSLPGSIGPAVVSRIKIMAELNIVEKRRPQDGQISLRIEDREVDIRVSTTAVVGGERVVMRLLDKSRPLFELAQLGMPDDVATKYESLLRSPYGMVICAGPTGGGKTTTLYASLGELNSPDRNIMTIEDPVEYTFDTINQIQIHEQAGITFANGLRSILRQDPDIILVGEVRDVETARIAVQSALTGHFVLSSLHATDSISALYRLIDMGIERFLVASSITAVVAQRLVRRTCTYCREPYKPSPEELAFMNEFSGVTPAGGFTHGAGCNFCSHTGFLDRIGVYELMAVTDEVRELILERGSHDELRKLCQSQGMSTLLEESLRLVGDGVTTLAEVMRTIYVAGA
ncbi:MAG TPA: ATPase, T2SS/T4P/T4SS family [Jatrophihabitans sp.]|jgi:type IV pilus assembly protein PilB|uniref:GspE/PulE family protein n=1 Tax=Jatrophihabitans sp. TaxID=1932789 RepID=UPI002E03FD9F|nr:ATPase, T2SS/T4P/T4SS family [Jatrophihabitans sp.]